MQSVRDKLDAIKTKLNDHEDSLQSSGDRRPSSKDYDEWLT